MEDYVVVAAPITDIEPSSVAERRIDRFVDAVARALADDETNVGVRQADVTVRLDVTDRPGLAVHLLFAQRPARVSTGHEAQRPDVRITLRSADLDCFLAPGQNLPLRILSGEITFEGYVRKLLRVLPILRAGAQRTDPRRES